MPDATPQPPKEIQAIADQLPDAHKGTTDAFDIKDEGYSEKLVDAIEMIGEENAAGFKPPEHSAVSPGMRYLHSSRTIHQLVTDRNRAVGIFMAVASLLLTASGALMNANPPGEHIIPMEEIRRWCFPVTFAALTVLAFFAAFLLIRTRVGLIYEVAKMNALLGLPIGRVTRIGMLSIHFILQALISVAGGVAAAMFTIYMVRYRSPQAAEVAVWIGVIVGLTATAALLVLYVGTVLYTTADHRLQAQTK